MPNVVDMVKQASSPQEALFAIAAALDRIEAKLNEQPADDGWGEWQPLAEHATIYGAGPRTSQKAAIIESIESTGDDDVVIALRAVDPEKQARRATFAREVLDFPAYTKELQLDPEVAIDAYSKGGPVWLYHGNRDLFMNYDWEIRRLMVQDVLEEDPAEARDMGRDVLVLDEDAGEAWTRTATQRYGSVPE